MTALVRTLFRRNLYQVKAPTLTRPYCTSSPAPNLNSLTVRRLMLNATKEPDNFYGTEVTVQGWVKYLRRLGRKMTFVRLVDGTTAHELQIVIEDRALAKCVLRGSAIRVTGTLVKSPKPEQPVELLAASVTVFGSPVEEVTETVGARSSTSPVHLRHQLHLRAKHSAVQAVLRCRHAGKTHLHQYLNERDFLQVDVPVLTASDCEGGGEVFTVSPANAELLSQPHDQDSQQMKHYFGTPAYLTVSGQLHLECITAGLARAYSFSPTFRAERNVTKQHLAEFQMLEVECAFEESLDNLMTFVEAMLRSMAHCLLESCNGELQLLRQAADRSSGSRADDQQHLMFHDPFIGLNSFVASPNAYARLTYAEAVRLLKQSGESFEHDPDTAAGLMKEHEWWLVRQHNNTPLFITHYPVAQKPFYMKHDGDKAICFDLLAPLAGEICGGSLRENEADVLAERLRKAGVSSLQWYVDLRRSGYAPTAGFGIGFERLLQALLNIRNAKDTLPFPRWYGNCPL